jgi:hypothetical protein
MQDRGFYTVEQAVSPYSRFRIKRILGSSHARSCITTPHPP